MVAQRSCGPPLGGRDLTATSGSLDDMIVFAAVVRDGTLTAAAKSLGITKQAISHRIARLEGRIG
ncbi:MAG TPA: LysR family transcriptional regulator, partial [Burkholderiaceae bacterium]